VAAVLTVLCAFHVAGRPVKPSPLGSFEKWSNLIRAALLWMRAADPVLSIEEVKKSDPRRNELTSVIDQWRTVIGSESVTVAQIIKRATETRMNFESSESMHADFREALLAVAAQGGAINSKRLGHWLNAHKDRIVSGFFFQQMGTRQGAAVWSIRRTSCS
jgi:putative DNA primase/helicase